MKLDLTVPTLACSACVETVTKAFHSVDAIAQVATDPRTKQVSIVTNAAETDIRRAI